MEKRLSRAFRLHRFTVLALLLLATISAVAQKPATTSPSTVSAAENRTAHTLDLARADAPTREQRPPATLSGQRQSSRRSGESGSASLRRTHRRIFHAQFRPHHRR